MPRDRRRFGWMRFEILRGIPLEWKMHHGAWLRNLFERPQRRPQYRELTLYICGKAQR